MKILLTGATGYIGKRVLPTLIKKGHEIICLVRDPRRLYDDSMYHHPNVFLMKGDLLNLESLEAIPKDIDAAYYFVHSMTNSPTGFSEMEEKCAKNFSVAIKNTSCKQIIYLGGISNSAELSKHLSSRQHVECILKESGVPLTVLRAAIIIGSGSASFEIIRDLCEKLPVMVAPKWLKTKCQPIGIRNVICYLEGVLGNEKAYNQIFDIGGPDILTYREMLMQYAKVRKLKRYIISVPVLTPKLSSYWLYFITSTSYSLASSLVDSLKNEVICEKKGIEEIVPQKLLTYEESLELAFMRIRQNEVVSSWIEALRGPIEKNFMDYIQVPEYGCLKDHREFAFKRPVKEVIDNVWQIGGERGWYYGNFLWEIRGLIDKMVGGVGVRRGRRSPYDLQAGDALDFWRVLVADKENGRLLLFAEMKLPGEAWLEFKITPSKQGTHKLTQNATFRPLGIWGRLYWYIVLPFHGFIFPGMVRGLIDFEKNQPEVKKEKV
ncbi:SDR family oxidoreductase [Sediminitomix flava]|uniref:Uncharacterized protein YbjT (DUF2867 family) n=1 Tax=Sediminitomix flava TaxID=379075 RepID=A0A315ZAQ7_SEDFL|nr:SDR family oxidoreductase [Sediminitomix flava]PWJ42631.1 uncharacterized protein YbjT (DUF2867 family) [Sediminitomix flava]